MRRFIVLIIVVFIVVLVGCNKQSSQDEIQYPLNEQDVKRLMADKMNIEGWKLSKEGDQYLFSFIPKESGANGMSYAVNAKTGTVYDEISGGPQTNLVVKDAPNFMAITNGEDYYIELYKLANPILQSNGLVPSNKDWLTGGYGDGYLYGDVLKGNQSLSIKLDVFTKQWEQIEDEGFSSSNEPEIEPTIQPSKESSATQGAESDPVQEYIAKVSSAEDKIVFYEEEDLDLDGVKEIIVALGTPGEDANSSSISQVYILHNIKGKVEQLVDPLISGGYYLYDIKLIRLQDMPKVYIYCGNTNGADLLGFEIYELADNELQPVAYSASATGVGDDELLDINKDGQYDSYVQNRMSYDVFYYPVQRTFVWENKDFVIDHTFVELPPYPDNARDVLLQYISLKVLNEDKAPEVDARLAELYSNSNAINVEPSWDSWNSAVSNTILEIGEPEAQLDIKLDEKENSTVANVTFQESNKIYKISFELSKVDGKWSITAFQNM
ncbi:hypothetical protein [Cohnella sp. WQ 127256]|uniref:hypothetical protein n=1 Tax=Cohnella sp. WQ 127256 TaxID=2938790 RepID=UPI002119268E|nr:hypothetical protein [Cohnella sp. WQ 127256]